jgi:hypothetical protein
MKKIREKIVHEISCYVCDRCGLEASVDDIQSREVEEFVSIERVGGYCSIFGDGNQISVDICQHCLKDVLGEWLRIRNLIETNLPTS